MNPPGRQRSKELNHGALPGYVLQKPILSELECNREDSPLVYAIISSWHDSDIIAATVTNCFKNGCSKVFLLDNASPDDSVKNAKEAGALVAEVYETEYYDDDLRIRKQNNIVKTVVEMEKHRELWFITLDADEFPTGINGESFSVTLGRLPGDIRTIGSNAIDLYPTGTETYEIGDHPASCYSKGINRTAKFACNQHHWKHVAIRYFNGRFDICQSRGNHYPAVLGQKLKLQEPNIELPIFHVPIRNREFMEQRLTALCGKQNDYGVHRSAGDDDAIGGQGAIKRFRSLDAIYSQGWHEVELPHSQMYGRQITGICPYPWRVLHPELDKNKSPLIRND
jgi:hypothetical protein